jgi:hypothetical protein
MPDQVGFAPTRGTAVLNGLSVVNVPCPTITANSLIFTNLLVGAGTLGVVVISSRTPGVGFGVTSVLLNTSTIAWMVIEP